jgi:SAM-dependent methyltransferase
MKIDVQLNRDIYEKRYNSQQEMGFYEPFCEIILKILLRDKCKTILDYGCGPGSVAKYLIYKGVRDRFVIDGVDISPKATEMALNYYDSVYLSDGDFFPEGKKYDIVLLNSIIEHLEQDRLNSLFKKLQASTQLLFIVVPNFYSPRRILKGRQKELAQERTELGHVNFLSKMDITQQLQRFGYDRVQFSFFHIFRDLSLVNYLRFRSFKFFYFFYTILALFPFYYCKDSFWVYARRREDVV